MKGPSLPFELRALRIFRCAACGREIQAPGRVTSFLCSCSEPARFMQAIDRPKTPIPDMTAFLSPADPEELAEELVEEEPYVPYVPVIVPRPPQFPSRRKLSDEIDKFVSPEFGDGLEPAADGSREGEATSQQLGTTAKGPGGSHPTSRRNERQDRGRREPRGRGRNDSADNGERRPSNDRGRFGGEPHSRQPDRKDSPPSSDLSDSQSVPQTGTADDASPDASSQPALGAGNEARRSRRRRGRGGRGSEERGSDTGAPRSSTDEASETSGSNGPANSPANGPANAASDDFGSGLELRTPGNKSRSPRPHQAPRPDHSPRPGHSPNVPNANQPPTDHHAEDFSGADGPDDSDTPIGGGSSAPGTGRPRRSRRRGRRRGPGSGSGENSGSGPGQGSGDGSSPPA